MKTTAASNDDGNNNNHDHTKATHLSWLVIKQKEAIIKIYDLSDKAQCLMYTNQTGKFPKKSSHRYQYIMVLIKIDSNAILVEAMKNRTAGKMIRACQVRIKRLRSTGFIQRCTS
jgi:hypothetical protein